MKQVLAAAEIITSNRVYTLVMERLVKQLKCENALLLAPVNIGDAELMVVEAAGVLPPSLDLEGIKKRLDALPEISIKLAEDKQPLPPYCHIIRFTKEGRDACAYLLFSGPSPRVTGKVHEFINDISRLFCAKQSIDNLEVLRNNQSKLAYQLNFMASIINNIFEPYGNDFLLQLYLEIVSEMFAFPSAVVLKLQDGVFRPIISKGIKLGDIQHFVLDAPPLLANSNVAFYPTIMRNCTPANIGEDNYKLMAKHGARVIFPLQTDGHLDCLMICFSFDDHGIGTQDSLTLIALGTILNKAREMNLIKENLVQSNRVLDQKLFALAAVYRAAEVIFSSTDIKATMQLTLDMLMEIFQSGVSSIFLYEEKENRLEMMQLKSAFTVEEHAYWLNGPLKIPTRENSIVKYKYDDNQREAFLSNFPGFGGISELLDPVLILHLTKSEVYLGFITLSERVTGQVYGPEDLELLGLLINSVTAAVENVLIYEQLKIKNEQLEQSLANIFAIQDVLGIIREARDLDSFLKLLVSAVRLGVGVNEMQILTRTKNCMVPNLNEGPLLSPEMIAAVEMITENEVVAFADNRQALVFPIKQRDWIGGYLLIWSFADTILMDGERIKLLSIIASIIEEPFNRFLELQTIVKQDVLDLSQLVLYRLQQEVNRLEDMGLDVTVIKVKADKPHTIISACREWAEGLVYMPQAGLLVTCLSEEEAQAILAEMDITAEFLSEISASALYN
ncbi:MAG: GAF domain-containing protein [Deltaproteobacteria bacterium]